MADRPTDNTPLLVASGLTKRFPAMDLPAVRDVGFTVGDGEIVSLLGPSGCGKTTTLRLISGFERPDSGAISIGGRSIVDLPPERRGIGIVFQDYALFPHLTVLENVMFGLRTLPKAERRARAQEMLDLVFLADLAQRMPQALSGGQQQRIALARSLATHPRLILLDEPFSNLDATLREETRQEVRTLLRKVGSAAILVTHDQEEALAFSDRIVVMNQGRVEQMGTPEEVYRRPRTVFVARFLGRSNVIAGNADGLMVETPLGRLPIDRGRNGHVAVAVRPEQLILNGGELALAFATIVGREFRGHDLFYWLRSEKGADLLAISGPGRVYDVGETVSLTTSEPATVLEDEVRPAAAE